MSSSNKRKTGGAWRRCKAMTALHAKQGKDRMKAKQGSRIHEEAALTQEKGEKP